MLHSKIAIIVTDAMICLQALLAEMLKDLLYRVAKFVRGGIEVRNYSRRLGGNE